MICSNCGGKNNQDSNYCTNCGVMLLAMDVSSNIQTKRKVYLEYTDSNGVVEQRSSSTDFYSLPQRHINVLFTIPGFEEDEKLQVWLRTAMDAYNGGWYDQSLRHLQKSLKRLPELEPFLFYYIRVCKRVLSVDLTEQELQYKERLQNFVDRYNSMPKWLNWLVPRIELKIRCKWCGRYTKFVPADDNSFGFIAGGENSCRACGISYPSPSWKGDSPNGRAYSYYRRSFPRGEGGEKFYEEFLADYEPIPTVEESGLFKE